MGGDGGGDVTGGYGGDSSAVATQLNGTVDVKQIFSTGGAFAALRMDGSVVTWGDSGGGGSNAVAAQLNGTVDVAQIASTDTAFGRPTHGRLGGHLGIWPRWRPSSTARWT